MKYSEWTKIKLKELCEIKYGKDHKKLKEGYIPVYGSGGIIRFVDTMIYNKKSVLIPRKGTLANLFLVNPPFWTVDTIFWTDVNNSVVETDFLYYILHTKNLAEMNVGTAVPSLTTTILNELELDIPSIETQKKIARTLSSLDKKIELNNKINDNLEQQAHALFKSWFVDFEPFDGVMPADWTTKNLLFIADYINGLAMQKYRPQDDGDSYPVLKIKELRQGSCDSSSDRCSKSIKSDYLVHDGDVIFSWSGSLMLDFWCGATCGLNQHLFKVTSAKYHKWFYYFWTNFHLQKFITIAEAKATTMGHIKRGELETSEVFIPDNESYTKLTNIIQPMLDSIIERRIENRKLSQLRDTLLPKLMIGEIDVSQVKI